MAVPSKANPTSVFELKSATLDVLAFVLRTPDAERLRRALTDKYGEPAGLFEQEAACLDLSALRECDGEVDFRSLIQLLQAHGLQPVAARGGSEPQMLAAQAAGLAPAPELRVERSVPVAAAELEPVETQEPETPAEAVSVAPVREPALLIDKPLRSGQRVYAKGRDLVVTALVSYGAEVIADGNIHVYAPLRGRALAGAQGDVTARVFATCMEPQLVSIAGTWKTFDEGLPVDVAGKPAQVRLDGDKLLFEPLKY